MSSADEEHGRPGAILESDDGNFVASPAAVIGGVADNQIASVFAGSV